MVRFSFIIFILESVNYFPFTHGDKIEEAKIKQKKLLNKEMRKKLNKSFKASKLKRFSISFYNPQANIQKLNSMLMLLF